MKRIKFFHRLRLTPDGTLCYCLVSPHEICLCETVRDSARRGMSRTGG